MVFFILIKIRNLPLDFLTLTKKNQPLIPVESAYCESKWRLIIKYFAHLKVYVKKCPNFNQPTQVLSFFRILMIEDEEWVNKRTTKYIRGEKPTNGKKKKRANPIISLKIW